MKKERGIYGNILAIAVPVALQNLVTNALTLTDTLMIAQLGETAISATALSGKYNLIFSFAIFGIIAGASVLAAQYWGKKETDAIGKVIAIALKLGMLVGAVFSLAAIMIPQYLLLIFTNVPSVIEVGAPYLRLLGISIMFNSISQVYMGCMRSVERVKIAFVTVVISFFVNLVVNAVLIFGLFGFPRLGVLGAAIGVLAARIVELIVTIIYAKLFNRLIVIRIRDIIHVDRVMLKDVMRYSAPVIINEALWGLGFSLHSAVYGHMGESVTAANNIAGSIQNLLAVMNFGVAAAAAIVIGKSVGSGQFDKARKDAGTLMKFSIMSGLASGLMILATSFILPDIGVFNISAETADIVRSMLLVYSILSVFQSLNCTIIIGILRGGGDIRFSMLIDIGFLWLAALPLGAITAFVLNAPVIIVMCALMIDELLKLAFGLTRVLRGNWCKNLTR